MSPPAVHQYTPQVCEHDAVGNELFALQDLLHSFGIRSEIFCDLADPSLALRVRPISRHSGSHADVLIVHFSHGSPSYRSVFRRPERKILVYHNITPAAHLEAAHERVREISQLGRLQLPEFTGQVELALAHSRFSAQELTEVGFPRVQVLPYVLLERLYAAEPDAALLSRWGRNHGTNVLFVGRIVPNKCLEDCIFVFDHFKKVIEGTSRLFIVGNWQGTELYLARLRRLVGDLGLRDVTFTGPVRQDALVAYYRVAQAFLYMSEHEGFGVPVVEAMRYGVPVLAYEAGAIPETLRGAGLLFKQKCWPTIAESIGLVSSNKECRDSIISEQYRQAAHYSSAAARARVAGLLRELKLL